MKTISMKKILNSTKFTDPKPGYFPEWAVELEPVRKLPTKTGSRIRNCIYRALEKSPPRWAKKRLELSISKEVYKGNACGPTKREVVSVLGELDVKIAQERNKKRKKKKKGSVVVSVVDSVVDSVDDGVADLVMKQCRIVLRRVAAEDKEGKFCELLEGDCLDLRSIDLRLDEGYYCGSHEAFYDDVVGVFRGQGDLIELGERLQKIFGEMYDREVLAIVKKAGECASSEAMKERDEVLARVKEGLIPKAPWEEGVCGVCGVDKDDVNVLLCDGCDSQYHKYCLDPPMKRIPKGDWYCPSCVTGQCTTQSTLSSSGVFSQCTLEKVEGLDQLANEKVIKDCRESNGEEGTICLQCGDVGFDNAYVYCKKCLEFAVHRYCLPEIPKTFDEFVHWVCDDCGEVSSGSTWQKDLPQDERCTKPDRVHSS